MLHTGSNKWLMAGVSYHKPIMYLIELSLNLIKALLDLSSV
jgi:hypothetical protein